MWTIEIKITNIKKNTPAAYSDISAGDILVSVNGVANYSDIIQLRNAFTEEKLELDFIPAKNNKVKRIIIEKEIDEDLGLEFESAVFDGVRECHNNCEFCFVRQMPAGMRESLYVKDDDYRLSFLYGNFVTLSNLTELDKQRIVGEHLSPLYISVHATAGEVRKQMMHNKYADQILAQLAYLKEHAIQFHTQIVLCPGKNDGAVLEKTLSELISLAPATLSVAIVPVGLTKYRDNLPDLRQFTAIECKAVIKAVENFQKKCIEKFGRSFVYLADEFYINAAWSIPKAENYDGFPQLENGIGLTRCFLDSWQQEQAASDKLQNYLLITGKSAYKVINPLIKFFNQEHNTENIVYAQNNNFFGDDITVTGLLTAQDLSLAVQSHSDYDNIIIPAVTLRKGEDVFLDNVTLKDFRKKFQEKNIYILETGAQLKELLCKGVN